MRHRTLAEDGFEKCRKPTRREQFLDEMNRVIPWRELCKLIKPFYPVNATLFPPLFAGTF